MTTPPLNLRPLTPPPGEAASSPSDAAFSYESSPHLYLFTSLTAGSSHIITATSRLETILKANRVPFKAVDCATDEKARRIWSRRAGKRKLPGLVKGGTILADLELVEEWNEFGEIKEHLGGGVPATQAPAQAQAQSQPASQLTAAQTAQAVAQQPTAGASNPEPAAPSTSASTSASTQSPQQQQQSMLAQQVAAIAAQRGKPKTRTTPSSTTATAKSEPLPTSSEESKPSTNTADSAATRSPPPRSPERDEDRDIEDTTHNTTTSAALPPLSIRTANNAAPATSDQTVSTEPRGRADTTTSIQSIQSPNMPNAPPSTAVDATPPPSQLSVTFEPRDTAPIAEESADPTTSAGPASKSGLEAVTSSSSSPPLEEGLHQRRRSSNISAASPEEVAEIEQRDSIPEVSAEDEKSDPQDTLASSATSKYVEVSYGDGYDVSHDLQANDDEDEDEEKDKDKDEDEGGNKGYADDSGQFGDAGVVVDDGEVSPRILRNEPGKHIKFFDHHENAASKEAEEAADAWKAGESVDD